MFRSIALFGASITRGVHLNGGNTASRRILITTGLTGYSRFIRGLTGNCSARVNRGNYGLSNNRHREVSVTHTFLGGTPVVLLSRTATSLSIRGRALVRATLSGLVRGGAMVIVTREVEAIRGTSGVMILSSKGVTRYSAPSGLVRGSDVFGRVARLRATDRG